MGSGRRRSEPYPGQGVALVRSRSGETLAGTRRIDSGYGATHGAPAQAVLALIAATAWFLGGARGANAQAAVPSVSLGQGRSEIVEYDSDLRPIRRYTGLEGQADVAATPGGTILLADRGGRRVAEVARDGTVLWSDSTYGNALRIRSRPGGGFLITAPGQVIALRPDRSIDFGLSVPGVVAAVPLANGNVVAAYNREGQGWLAEMNPSGQALRRTAARGYADASGRWLEDPEHFISVSSVDVRSDGSIVAANFDGGSVRLLTPEFGLAESIGGFAHPTDARFGPRGDLVVANPEMWRVWWRGMDGRSRTVEPPMIPVSAAATPWGTLLVATEWLPEREALNATALRERNAKPVPWWQQGLPLPALAVLLSLLVAAAVRKGGRASSRPRRLDAEPATRAGCEMLPSIPEAKRRPPLRRRVLRIAGLLICAGILGYGGHLMWMGIASLRANVYAPGVQRFIIGAFLAGVALRVLNGLLGVAPTLSSFRPADWRGLPVRGDRARTWTLLVLSLAGLSLCIVALPSTELQAVAVSAWVSAQVLILASAFPPRGASEGERKARTWERALLVLLLFATLVSRLWQIGEFPDNVHPDHEMYGAAVLSLVRGDWRPFFIGDPFSGWTFARPWLVPAAAAMALFGSSYWVLRLSAAASAVALVWATALLSSRLFNWRVGLVAGFLVAVNHSLMVYSRQPYVIESTAPFFLLLYCAFTGARRGCRFHWCMAGIIAGWAMFATRQCTTFPFICGAIFLLAAASYPRAVWRERFGLLWMTAAAAVVYAPLVPSMLARPVLLHRLGSVSAILNSDRSINWDWSLWQRQLLLSYGSIIHYADASPWGFGTGWPVCLRPEACLFGLGLVYLLISRCPLPTITLLATMVVSVFLGSVLLVSPPGYYHFFVGMVAALVVSAVALDRLAALFDRFAVPWRAVAVVGLLGTLGQIAKDNLSVVWSVVGRPLGSDQEVLRAAPVEVAARFVRTHPDARFFLVRSRHDHSSGGPHLLFAAADSDISDISSELRDVLPIEAVDPAPEAVFLIMPSRSDQRQVISEIYPGASRQQVLMQGRGDSVWIYRISADEIRSKVPREKEVGRPAV